MQVPSRSLVNRARDPSIELSPSDGSVRALGASAVLGFWSSLATCAPHHFLPATTSFDYGRRFQTAETCSPPAECGHQGREYHEGCFRHNACHARFLCRHYSSNVNKGMLSLLLQRSVPASRATRTLWPIEPTTLCSC